MKIVSKCKNCNFDFSIYKTDDAPAYITIFIIGSIIIVCCIIQDRYRIQDISNQLSDIESDNEDTIVQAEIVDADAEILQLEFVSPEQLYNTENLTNVVLANPIEN